MNRGQLGRGSEQVSKIEPVLAADTRGRASGVDDHLVIGVAQIL
jgi:hypothetical protein